jgi:hypothetical protein
LKSSGTRTVTRGKNDDRLLRSGIRHGCGPVPRYRQSPRNSNGRAWPHPDAKTGGRRLLSDPPGRRHGGGVRRLPRSASPDAWSDQGRHTLCTQRRFRRGRRPGDLDELEMRAGRPAFWRRQGWDQRRSLHDFQARAGSALAALHAGDDPLCRAAYRRDGAGYGYQRAGDGLVHGHLFRCIRAAP